MNNEYRPVDKVQLTGGRVSYTGDLPFEWDKESPAGQRRMFQTPWAVDFAGMRDVPWRCVGVESFALRVIRQGSPVGLIFEPWPYSKS